MTEHNHNHDVELDISNEEELLTLFDENGNEVLYRKMLEFYHPEFKKNMLFQEGAQSDDDDMIELIPMINEPDESGDGGKLVPIETDEEWDMIEEVVNTNMEEQFSRFNT